MGRGVRFSQLVATTADRVVVRPAATTGGWQAEAVFAPAAGSLALRPAVAETVRVPAGTFAAVRLEQPGAVSWYAPGVGLVRRQSLATGVVEELERYVLPVNPAGAPCDLNGTEPHPPGGHETAPDHRS